MAVTDSPYGKGQYSAGFYARQKALADKSKAASQYDLRRQQVTAEGEQERTDIQKKVMEQKAGQGFGKDSGILEGAQRTADVEQRKAMASRLGAVDVAQMEAGERSAEAEKGRAFTAGENALSRGLTTSENALSRGLTTSESALSRGLTREVEAGRMTLAQSQLAQQASQFKTQQEWTEKAFQLGMDQHAADLVWQDTQRVAGQDYQKLEREAGQTYNTEERVAGQTYQSLLLDANFKNNLQLANLQRDWSNEDVKKNALILSISDWTGADFVTALDEIIKGTFSGKKRGWEDIAGNQPTKKIPPYDPNDFK